MTRRMLGTFLGLGLGLAPLQPLLAQQAVTTIPQARSTLNASGSITSTGPFQLVIAKSANRANCTVQNTNASNVVYVFFGPIASATQATSVKLAAGQAVSCAAGGVTLADDVSVSGTSGDTFYAGSQ